MKFVGGDPTLQSGPSQRQQMEGREDSQSVFPGGTGYLVKTEDLTQKNLTEVTEPSISRRRQGKRHQTSMITAVGAP